MDTLTIPQQIARMDLDRLRVYQENLDFYIGIQWPGRARRGERRLTFNYAKAFVDKLTSYLISGLSVVVEPWDGSPEAAERARRAQEALRQVEEANALERLDFETELDTAILGDGCYKVTWAPRMRAPPEYAYPLLTYRASSPGGWPTIRRAYGASPAGTASPGRPPRCSTARRLRPRARAAARRSPS